MDIKSNTSSIESKVIRMCVVPVKASHSKSKKGFSRYAIHENCSQGTFIKEYIQKKQLEQLAVMMTLQSRFLMENRV